MAERLADLGDFLAAHPDSVLPVTRAVLERGRRVHARSTRSAPGTGCRSCGRGPTGSGQRVDVLLLPTVGTTFTLAEIAAEPMGRNLVLGRYTQFANLLDLAAVAVPNGHHRRTAARRPDPVRPGVLGGPAAARRARTDHQGGRMTMRTRPA